MICPRYPSEGSPPPNGGGGRNHARSCAILFAVLIRSRPIPRAHSVCLPSGWASMSATIPEGSSQGSTPWTPPGRFPQGFPQGDPPPQGTLQGFAQGSTPDIPRRNLPPGIPPREKQRTNINSNYLFSSVVPLCGAPSARLMQRLRRRRLSHFGAAPFAEEFQPLLLA